MMSKHFLPISKRLQQHLSSGYERYSSCPQPEYGPAGFQRSKMLNGIHIAAVRTTGCQMAACTIMYQAGSRYEVGDELGASHFVRATSGTSGCGYSAFAKMRYLQQYGAYITCSSNRQYVAFTLRCPQPMFPELKYYLLDAAGRCHFHPWEVKDCKNLIRDSLTLITPEQRVIDLVQRACFAGPLNNSVFCEEQRIDSMSADSVKCFAMNNFRSDACSVASVGVPFEETMNLAEKIDLSRTMPSKQRVQVMSRARAGFETYDLGAGSDTWIAVCVPGCGTCDLNCLLKHAIVAAACGAGNIAAGQHEIDRTPQTPLGLVAGCDPFTDYKAFNISYQETGVFGIVAKTRSQTAKDVALAAAEFLSNVGDLDFQQIDIGKKRLMVSMALQDDDSVQISEGLALQCANNHHMEGANSYIAVLDKITPDEVSQVALALTAKSGCMAVAVVGDVDKVPHDRHILCGTP